MIIYHFEVPSGENFGQKSPPLTLYINGILGRYPDGGQILKELIQNADDAGAKEVKFLYDDRTFKSKFLASPGLQKFQGPALYAYNDAMFEPEDWEGIQNPQSSNKAKNPMKVGRFGIGFNSVYHITDLPGISSGNYIGFLDPHEKYFGERRRGSRYNIGEDSLHKLRDQFQPFHNVYGWNRSKKTYNGTLFRFPLRTEPSDLSEKVYTKAMIDDIFNSLQEEAPVILLFLKTVQTISVEKRAENGNVEVVFRVEVSKKTSEKVKKDRLALTKNALKPGVWKSRFILEVDVTTGSTEPQKQNYQWLVLNQIGSENEQLTKLAEKLSLLPWIGCAVRIDISNEKMTGRIFCFLPLPPDVDCETGLPVLLHGYFGMMDNRRGLIWPGNESQHNDSAEWNELLVKEVATVVYSDFFDALISDQFTEHLSVEKRVQLTYSLFPDSNKVKGHWLCILDPLFENLYHKRLFYCQSREQPSNESWITLSEGILDRITKSGTMLKTRDIVLKVLKQYGLKIISDLPKHVDEAVDKYFGKTQVIDPAYVRNVLKNPDAKINTFKRQEKILLLDFVLTDNPSTDLSGVPLLPLLGGALEFTTFRPHCHDSEPSLSVFVPSESCSATLLPNMPHRFLDEDLSKETSEKLRALAATNNRKRNATQLVVLTKEIVIENLVDSLPKKWSDVVKKGHLDKVHWDPDSLNHPSRKWLQTLWEWIRVHFPDSLDNFPRIPLIPLCSERLGILSPNSKFIARSSGSGDSLPSPVIQLLTDCDCTVVDKLPPFACHPEIDSYVVPPTAAGTITVLCRTSVKKVKEHIKGMSSKDRRILRKFLSCLRNITCDQKQFLRSLPIFDSVNGTSTSVQVKGESLKAVSEFHLPKNFNFIRGHQLISCTSPTARQLLGLLSVEIMQPAEVLVHYLFPDILSRNVYGQRDTSTVMLWTLNRIFVFKSQYEDFFEKMKCIPFVSTSEDQIKRPTDLYDPCDTVLCDLFSEEKNKFPNEDFRNKNIALKKLGIRTRAMLTADELLGVAQNISSSQKVPIVKINALLNILKENPNYLQHIVVKKMLKDQLVLLRWLPCKEKPPENICFPRQMPWCNVERHPKLFKPTELRCTSLALLIGASMPILDIEMDDKLQDEFNFRSSPPLDQVVKQLQIAVQSCLKQKFNEEEPKFQLMLKEIYKHLSQVRHEDVVTTMKKLSLKQWIWHGSGFCSPQQMAFEKDFPLDLRPQLFLIPKHLQTLELKDFFQKHGVRKKFTEKDILSVLTDIKNKHEKSTRNIHTKEDHSQVDADLNLCRSILEWVVKDGNSLPEILQEKVFVPVQSPKNILRLEPREKCMYCDKNWLRSGQSELDIPGNSLLIHDTISTRVASLLGVPTLSSCLVSAEPLEYEQTGPFEPITTRLNNILKEYKEDVGVFKELVQNADDAGASKIHFLIDWRCGPQEQLLSSKMAKCQGPALWAYNDAVFTDKDFENINKLAGATKVEDLSKIGRFGLGFNAVYHLTDVPSFVSRDYFVMFDPNTNHIEDLISDKSRPGIRINFCKNPRPLSAFEDQFQPYHGIFGCDVQPTDGNKFYYDGTLFRFPFRTSSQAKESDICQSVYDRKKVKEIVARLKESASLLLLFTQHVQVIELYELSKSDDPGKMRIVLSVEKKAKGQDSFIQECSNWWQRKLVSGNTIERTSPARSERITLILNEMPSALFGCKKQNAHQEEWVVISCVGNNSSIKLASSKEGQKHGLLPCAGAAVKLSRNSKRKMVDKLKAIPEAVTGEAFCFLPLSYNTGLPVHINGCFAITSNRLGIWEKTSSEHSQTIEVLWNESLMEDAVTIAYLDLLNEIKRLVDQNQLRDYRYHVLWPRFDALRSITWEKLVKSFYSSLVNKSLQLFRNNGKWLDIHSGYILDDNLRSNPDIAKVCSSLNVEILDISSTISSSLRKAEQENVLKSRTLTPLAFFENIFIPNIWTISHNVREPIVLFGLDLILRDVAKFSTLATLFKNNQCITCSEDGTKLAKPCELINPTGAAARLYSKEDCRFPATKDFREKNRLYILETLGMVKDNLSWHEICERAKSIDQIARRSDERAVNRAKELIVYLNKNIDELGNDEKPCEKVLQVLRATQFLPFKREPPPGYILPWKGSSLFPKNKGSTQFLSPEDVFLADNQYLVGSSCYIFNELCCARLNEKVKTLLGFCDRQPSYIQVLQQLDIAIKFSNERPSEKNTALLNTVCNKVYEHLDELVTTQSEVGRNVRKELTEKKVWLFIQGRFVETVNVAMSWKGNAAPFLYSVPEEYCRKYYRLLCAAGVKQKFDGSDFLNALDTLQKSKKRQSLSEDEIKLTMLIVPELLEFKDLVAERVGRIPLPDDKGIMCNSEDLTINETWWLKNRGDARHVHECIQPHLAKLLGVKLLLDRRRGKYTSRFSSQFGQHEALTDRIKNILRSYPCDASILKELVQNADDAKASEIHFIYDTRTLPRKRVISTNVKDIHGPALCVYNNQPFSDADIVGIQKLGIGSKSDDPEKIGQYGIGFNAVYHLTDCPSFLSNDKILCMFDPHCRYAPGATIDSPGEQFGPVDNDFKEDFSDTLCGYLGEHFRLKGSTMFRLPLRNSKQSRISEISKDEVSDCKIRELLKTFKEEAKMMLIFLNFVKKISISEIDRKNEIKQTYSVESNMTKEDSDKCREMVTFIKDNKDKPTGDIPWNGITYPITLSDSERDEEKWLVHQCCGVKRQDDGTIYNGQPMGLFPRGGIAALLSPVCPENQQYFAYCFLPLPVKTPLPVHVNGHFVLNPSRRALWTDTKVEEPRTQWNNLMKSRVLAPGYAELVFEARNFIPHCTKDQGDKSFFQNQENADEGLKWYHGIFPDFAHSGLEWSPMVKDFYCFLGKEEKTVLPIVSVDEKFKSASPDCKKTSRKEKIGSSSTTSQKIHQQHKSPAKTLSRFTTRHPARTTRKMQAKLARSSLSTGVRRSSEPLIWIQEWLSAQKSFFSKETKVKRSPQLYSILLRIGIPLLLYSPFHIFEGFTSAQVDTRLISPMNAIEFLQTFQSDNSTCLIGQLPTNLTETIIENTSDLRELIDYCKKEETLSAHMKGLPLLLTADEKLRMFDTSNLVFRSEFSDIVPTKAYHQFVHPEFVDQWKLEEKRCEGQLCEVMCDLTVSALAEFMPDIFPFLLFTGKSELHVPWVFPNQGILSELWFRRLWQFLQDGTESESLITLGQWHVIPTSCQKLVTVDNGKSLLDVLRLKLNSGVKNIENILLKLNCPALHKDITSKEDMPSVLDHYVADPSYAPDVLQVLGYMSKHEMMDETRMDDTEIIALLVFFQNGIDFQENDKGRYYIAILKALPFFKSFNGSRFSLSNYSTCAVVPSEVIATKGLEKLQQRLGNTCLFLHPDFFHSFLYNLYESLSIKKYELYEMYENFILPYFGIFDKDCQIEYLDHIRKKNDLTPDHYFVRHLKNTKCIPDETGKLHRASDFYDPRNKVFDVMLDHTIDNFPSAPFDQKEWLYFLVKIGMVTDVNGVDFLKFCREVERHVASHDDEINARRSRALVEYLFDHHNVDIMATLWAISKVCFISPEKVEDTLFDLHSQYQYNETDEKFKYVSFHNSVLWECRELVWTSAQLLPSWADVPTSMRKDLRIQVEPRLETVLDHLFNICTSCEMRSETPASEQRNILEQILVPIYKFLEEATCGTSKGVSGFCCSECRAMGERLKSVSCVLIPDENTLIKGEQMSFSGSEGKDLRPFFYPVPREYGIYQHFLKRIGVTETVTSVQMASVLKKIKDCFDDDQANEKKSRDAMFFFFEALVADVNKESSDLSKVSELFLLSQEKRLVLSKELVCNVPPRLLQAVRKQKYNVLFSLEECGLLRARENNIYLQALPEHLRPKPLNTLVLDELDPSCRTNVCKFGENCPFIEKYVLLLRSTQFRRGIIRLMKHHKKLSELNEDEKKKAARFTSPKEVEILCMATIKAHLVSSSTRKPLEGSSQERICYATKGQTNWTLYIQHELGGNKTLAILSKVVNEVIDYSIEETCIAELTDMLSCDTPSDIPGVLNLHDISPDYSEDDEELGCDVPSVFHCLIQQNPICSFHDGARVVYTKDIVNEKSWNESTMTYKVAKITKRVGPKTARVGEYDFEAQYWVDIGSGTEELSVLDLYNINKDLDEELLTRTEFSGSSTPIISIDVGKEKSDLCKVLLAAWKLPLEMRVKVLRRLYLHWFQTKNSSNGEAVTEIINYLENKVERLENEEDKTDGQPSRRFFHRSFFGSSWDKWATRNKEIFLNFYRSSSDHSGHYNFSSTSDYTIPEPEEAVRWIDQSQADVDAASFLHRSALTFNAYVCFFCEQVVEKCLKAALYAKCGLSRKQLHTHDVNQLALYVKKLDKAPTSEIDQASATVSNYYLPTRYPNRVGHGKVPAKEFSKEQANEAFKVAKQLLDSIREFINGDK